MQASELINGHYFFVCGHNSPDLLECVDDSRPHDWARYPGIVYRNTRTGRYGGLGPRNIVELSAKVPAPVLPMNEISSGFGIGGVGSDDYNMGTEIDDDDPPVFNKHSSSGQLWEPCPKRGCDNEPVCLDCGLCLDKHCKCGE